VAIFVVVIAAVVDVVVRVVVYAVVVVAAVVYRGSTIEARVGFVCLSGPLLDAGYPGGSRLPRR